MGSHPKLMFGTRKDNPWYYSDEGQFEYPHHQQEAALSSN